MKHSHTTFTARRNYITKGLELCGGCLSINGKQEAAPYPLCRSLIATMMGKGWGGMRGWGNSCDEVPQIVKRQTDSLNIS